MALHAKPETYDRDGLETLYREFPHRFHLVDVTVSVTPYAEWEGKASHLGYYHRERKTMELKEPPRRFWLWAWLLRPFDVRKFRSTFAHELGHHHWYQTLTEEQRERWNRCWVQHRSRMPSEYARTSALEGFADCVEYTYYTGLFRPEVAAEIQQVLRKISE